MKVKCIHNIPGDGFLDIGSKYNVYGMSILDGNLNYLILSDVHFTTPSWHLAQKFEIINPLLPPIWYFNFFKYGDNEFPTPIWGYKEMVFNKEHIIDLIEYTSHTKDIFFKRKEEIDEFEDPEIKKPISEKSYY